MSYNHPFSSWAEGSSNSQWNVGGSQSPSVFGALPYPSDPTLPNMVTYYFTSFKPNVFNCSVVNSQSQTVYRFVTDDQMPGYTVIKNAEGRNVSLVEWQAHPLIEIRGHVSKQYVRNWLSLHTDKSSRKMTFNGMPYIWMPQERSINLYAAGHRSPILLARINRVQGNTSLDMTPDAIQLGLLDVAVSAALLFQCGRNID